MMAHQIQINAPVRHPREPCRKPRERKMVAMANPNPAIYCQAGSFSPVGSGCAQRNKIQIPAAGINIVLGKAKNKQISRTAEKPANDNDRTMLPSKVDGIAKNISKIKITTAKTAAPGRKNKYETMDKESGISCSETMPKSAGLSENFLRGRSSGAAFSSVTPSLSNGVWSITQSVALSGYSARQ